MISNILSQLFRLLFVFSIVGGLYSTITSIRSKASAGRFGQRGVLVSAKASYHNPFEQGINAKYTVTDSSGSVRNSGMLSEEELSDTSKAIPFLKNSAKANGYILKIDTQYSVIGVRTNKPGRYPSSFTSMDSLEDGRAVVVTKYLNSRSKVVKTLKDTLADIYKGRKSFILQDYSLKNEFIRTGISNEKLRILPAGILQKVIFFLYQLVISVAWCFLFYTLAVIFKNFSDHEFFTTTNRRLVLRAGWLIIIPQVATFIFYCLFLFNKYANAINFSSGGTESQRVANYEFESGVDYQLLTLGLGLIVLSYIFKQGLELEEEAALTV